MTKKRVAVLMSTYNGEKYLREQMESLFGQEGVDITICVRDDGSSDGTVAILREYAEANKIILYTGENLGFAKSFQEVTRLAPHCDYYAFCDQDDVWLPKKLLNAVEVLEKEDDTIPLMYYTNFTVVNENLEQIVKNSRGYIEEHDPKRFQNALLCTGANGCTEVFNNATREAFLRVPPDRIIGHDYSINTIASGLGRVIYSPESSILYRQHGGNALGYATGTLKNLIRSMKCFVHREMRRLRYREAMTFKYLFYDKMTPDKQEFIDLMTQYRDAKRLKRPLRKYIKKNIDNKLVRFYSLLLLSLGGL